MAVRHATNWKKAFTLGGKSKKSKSEHTGEIAGWWDDPEDPVHIINACAQAMLELWRDKSVRQLLMEKSIRLEESSGLYVYVFPYDVTNILTALLSYLNEISRITAKRYIPTDGLSFFDYAIYMDLL